MILLAFNPHETLEDRLIEVPLNSSDRNKILLSILIPAYEYKRGVELITESLGLLDQQLEKFPRLVEVIISDDSRTLDIAQEIFALRPFRNIMLRVEAGPKRGAVINWNALLASARGDYIWLVHHDDIPWFTQPATCLLQRLASNAADIFLVSVITYNVVTGGVRWFPPTPLLLAALKRFPWALTFGNFIGPPGAIIVRRSLAPRFDEKLVWMVDVVWYLQLLAKAEKWKPAGIRLLSLSGVDGQITQRIRAENMATAMEERKMAQVRYAPRFNHSKAARVAALLISTGLLVGLRIVETGSRLLAWRSVGKVRKLRY